MIPMNSMPGKLYSGTWIKYGHHVIHVIRVSMSGQVSERMSWSDTCFINRKIHVHTSHDSGKPKAKEVNDFV